MDFLTFSRTQIFLVCRITVSFQESSTCGFQEYCQLSGVAVGGAGVLPAAGAELRAGAGHRHVPGLGQGAGVTLGARL